MPRTSSDVDVLCDPARLREFSMALEDWGWRKYIIEDTGPEVLAQHASSYVHDFWFCGVDLHNTFPGFCASPQQAFDVLWDRKVEEVIAGQRIPACDRLGSSLVQALHLERNRSANWYVSDLDFLVTTVRETFDQGDLLDLATLARDTGSADTLAPFLDSVGAPRIGRGTTPRAALDNWTILTAAIETPVILWIEELHRSKVRRWPSIVWRGLTYNDHPSADLNNQISTRTHGVHIHHLTRRLWRAVRFTPRAVRELMRMRLKE